MSAPAGGRTIVLIGATSGIGRHAARQLAARGHRLIVAGRDARRGARLTADRVVFLRGDVATRAGCEALAAAIREHTGHIDTLVNNAGVMLPRRQVTEEGVEMNLAVHHLAPWTMTGLLMPLLRRGDGRIVNTNSAGHRTTLAGGRVDLDLDDLNSERHYDMFGTYSRTKLANLLFTYEFHRRYPDFTIVAVHPGMIRTRLVRGLRNPALWLFHETVRLFLTGPRRGAAPLTHLATTPDVRNGRYYDRFTPAPSSPQSLSRETARLLWSHTESLRGPLPT